MTGSGGGSSGTHRVDFGSEHLNIWRKSCLVKYRRVRELHPSRFTVPMRLRAILTGLLAYSLFRDYNNDNASAFLYTSTSSCLHSFCSNTCIRQQSWGSCPTSPSRFEDHVTTATCRAVAGAHTRRRRPRPSALFSTAGSAEESLREGGDEGEDAMSAASTPNMSSGGGGPAGEVG